MTRGKVIGAVVAVLAVGGAAVAFAVAGTRTTEVRAEAVTREDLSVVVPASGSVGSDSRIDVYPPTTGTLATIEVTDGQEVTAGQVLAVMDTAPIEVQVAQAEAAYSAAVAQRDAVAKTAPGTADKQAAQAAVDAAWSAYQLALARYNAAVAGLGAPTASDIADAQAQVALAQASADTAQAAYDSFYNDVYLPAPTPRAPELEAALAALSLARDQAKANLLTAQQGLAALMAAADNGAAVAAADIARDQAYAAYLGTVAQQDALAKASSVSGALSAANAAVAAAESARALAADTLERAEIVAPADGVVIFSSSAASLLTASGLGSAGSAASAGGPVVGSAVSPASAPFAIVSFETLAFTAQVDETDIARVEPGMATKITLDALPDAVFEAEVERIGKEAVLTPTGGTAFPVYLTFAAGGKPVLLGMNGSVEILVETVPDAVSIPVEALLEEGDENFVFMVKNGRAVRRTIEAGKMTDTRVQVVSGLTEGDRVIVSGVAELADGDRVKAE